MHVGIIHAPAVSDGNIERKVIKNLSAGCNFDADVPMGSYQNLAIKRWKLCHRNTYISIY